MTTALNETEQAKLAKTAEQAKQTACYSRAVSRLRELHREELDRLVNEEFAAAGLVRNRRRTKEEREAAEHQEQLAAARKRISELTEKFPELKDELIPVQ